MIKTYGSLDLTVASPPQIFRGREPVKVAEMATYLKRCFLPDEEELIESYIAGAREAAEYLQGRDLIPKQYDLHLDLFPACGEIELREPLQSVELIQYRDSSGATTSLTEDTDYIVDTARNLIVPAYGKSWPCFTPYPSSAVLIRFTSGYPRTHPFWLGKGHWIRIGMKFLISLWYNERLPFAPETKGQIQELPYTVTSLLSWGAVRRVR